VDCADARRLIAAFVHGGLAAKGGRVLRAHIRLCDRCRESYRTSLETAGRLGAARRRERETPPPPETRRDRHRRIVMLSEATRRHKRPRAALKAVLLTAAFVFLFATLSATIRVPPPLELVLAEGGVHVGDSEVSISEGSADVFRGDWCVTEAGGRARLEGDDLVLALGPGTMLMLEDSDVPRVLLRRGDVLVDGACEVTTSLGIVRVSGGSGHLRREGRRLTLKSFGGTLELVDAVGTRRVGPDDEPLVVEY
jgi:hypothetical protein